MEWINVQEKKPTKADGGESGYVMVYLGPGRQWGNPTNVGFSKFNRVKASIHTHWMLLPNPPKITSKVKDTPLSNQG